MLTDTLRQYIKERFGFNSLEMTTDQIIEHLQAAGDRKMIDELRQLFQTADLVKFAKYSTQLNENDMNLVKAVNFIDETKKFPASFRYCNRRHLLLHFKRRQCTTSRTTRKAANRSPRRAGCEQKV